MERLLAEVKDTLSTAPSTSYIWNTTRLYKDQKLQNVHPPQGSNPITAIAAEEEENAVDQCGNTAIFSRIVQFLYYSLCITTLILEFRCWSNHV
jgi:hypothetical protein